MGPEGNKRPGVFSRKYGNHIETSSGPSIGVTVQKISYDTCLELLDWSSSIDQDWVIPVETTGMNKQNATTHT